jgi:sec-independent protein translocase protein TatC
MTDAAPEQDVSMTFWEHLEELRSRLLKMVLAFLVGAGGSWFVREWILLWLVIPLQSAGKVDINYPGPASMFIAYLKISMLAGFVFALPIILYQFWSFIAPGLYKKEKRYAIPFVASSLALFAGGCYFGWKVAFPQAFQFLLSFGGKIGRGDVQVEIKEVIMVGDYIEFVGRMLLAFGAAFELPVVIFFLSIAGVVTPSHLIKFSRYFVVCAFLLSALITPPDVMSQFLLAIPLCVLYAVSIGVAYLFSRKRDPTPAA